MINLINIEGLFGLYDYSISLSDNPAVKILTGPNGYGKSTILLALDNLFRYNFWYFHFMNFKSFSITLTEETIEITKLSSNQNSSEKELIIESEKLAFKEHITLHDKEGNIVEQVVITDEYVHGRVSECRKRNMGEPSNMSDEEILNSFYSSRGDDYIQQNCKNISLALQEYETRFLPAQRIYTQNIPHSQLFRYLFNAYRYEIDHVNEEISKLYQKAQSQFASNSQRIDATFIGRLVKVNDGYPKDTLQSKLSELKLRMDEYKRMNLIKNIELFDYSLDDENSYESLKTALSLYVDDMNAKMDQFKELYKKISLYKDVISSKVLSEKVVDFSESGLTITNANGQVLPDLHKLSSGEQNLLILYYNLIFCSNKNTILLIDEPETSLHVAWQSNMLDDYIKMSETTGCQILIATHSPTFINGRWDLITDLYRQYKDKD